MNIVPSIELIPAKYGVGTLLTQVPMDVSGDFSVTRATNVATRFNAAGFIETVTSGLPRLDYYTSDGTPGCPALLVEPSGTNGILNSENTATSWTLGATLTSGYVDVIGVSGNNLTVAVSGSNIGVSAGRLQRSSNNVALASGSTYTISFLMKKTGTHTIGGYYANITGAASGNLGAGFDVSGSFSSGVLYDGPGTANRIRRVEQWGTDVYRCSETFTMTASGTLVLFNFAPVSGVTSQFHPAVGLGIAFAAPQIELGAVPTSFIPTTTVSVTRDADVINKTSVSGLIGQTEGTIYAEVDLRNTSSGKRLFLLSDGTSQNEIRVTSSATNAGDLQFAVRLAGTLILNSFSPTNVYSNGIFKIAAVYKSTDYALYVNGLQVLTGNGAGNIPACNRVDIGSQLGTSNFLNDRIRAVAVYKTRLSNYLLESATSQIESYSSLASSLSYSIV